MRYMHLVMAPDYEGTNLISNIGDKSQVRILWAVADSVEVLGGGKRATAGETLKRDQQNRF